MALLAFPTHAKLTQLADGTAYAYVYCPPSSALSPTFLLLHGFPSSSYDWRHQISQLRDAGYGVLAPDLLGYGDTDKPAELEAYRLKRISGHIVEILDREGLGMVVGVGHDWGSGALSRLVNYHASRLLATVFVSASYIEPGLIHDIDAANTGSTQAFGYPIFGYWKWFDTDEAAHILNQNPKSSFSLFYPADPELWKTDFCPIGAAHAWVTAGKTTPKLSVWITKEEVAMHDLIMARGGYAAPLNWYKCAIRGTDRSDEAHFTDEEKYLTLPNMLVVSTQDLVTRADVQLGRAKEWMRGCRVETLDCGHWIPLEKPNELTALLVKFGEEFAGRATE